MKSVPQGRVWGGALIISGTSVGAGMLALPILTGLGGLLSAIITYLVSWIAMSCTGLLLAEACIEHDKDVNLISLSKKWLGPAGKFFCWCVYLFLFYSLIVSYLSAGRTLLPEVVSSFPHAAQMLIFIAVLAPFVYMGAKAVDQINRLFVVGMIASYFVFIVLALPYINVDNFSRVDFSSAIYALPVSLLSFGYQGTVPTLVRYLEKDRKSIKQAIFRGTLITLCIYIAWGTVLLGIIPYEGEGSLTEMFQKGGNIIEPLIDAIGSGWISMTGTAFAFFAIITSFLGVTLGLRDFLIDGFNIKKTVKGKVLSLVLVFLPPFIIASLNPHIFLKALHYGGGIGGGILLGIFPILIAFRLRKAAPSSPRLFPSSNALLWVILLVFVIDIIFDLKMVL